MTKQKNVEEKEVKLWTIGVDVDSDCTDNHDGEDSNEPYSYRGTTTTTWHVNGLRLVSEESPKYWGYRETTKVNFEPKKGNLYHLLYAVYSTGDSFGHDEGKCFEVIGVYKSRKVAEENEKRLNEGKPSQKGSWGSTMVLLKLEGTTKQHPYNRPWDGYFERLDRLEVLTLVLN